jgi:hypothetical protein
MTVTKGNHSPRFGSSIYRRHHDFQEPIYPNCEWIYTGVFTGYLLGDFLLGLPQELVAVQRRM